jgi:formate dehydrogenase iron-sulfur subunit
MDLGYAGAEAGVEGARPRSEGGRPLPILPQEAQRTAGTRITPGRAYGFFTDTTLCIGCKACEVACKEWNHLPADGLRWTGDSYDNTRELSATTWRHVWFVEQFDGAPNSGGAPKTGAAPEGGTAPGIGAAPGSGGALDFGLAPGVSGAAAGTTEEWAQPGNRWLFMSDVCKHCVHAPCLEACPTGSIVYTEFGTVYVQQEICNGCGYCQSACPFAVIEVDKEGDGKAHKCTLCYDRLKDGLEPACAKSCPTDSIQFGPVDELLERAAGRVEELRARGIPAYLYGSGDRLEEGCDTSALGGLNAFFLLVDDPEVYNLPAAPRRPSTNTGLGLLTGALGALALTGAVWRAFAGEDG